MQDSLSMKYFTICILMSISTSLLAQRAMYVNDFANILNDTAQKTGLLTYAQKNEITYLIFYELHLVHNQHDLTNATTNQILADFLTDAKQNYGITKVAAAGENAWFFENRIIAYNDSRTLSTEKFDVLGMEFEFWTPQFTDPGEYYCVNYLTPNGFTCDNAGAYAFCKGELQEMTILAAANSHPTTVEMYVGWPTATQLQEIADIVDKTLIHAYVTDPSTAFAYALTRLEDYNTYTDVADISIIFSAEPNFMGPWLADNSLAEAEAIFMTNFNAATGSWKSQVNLEGFTYFTHSYLKPEPRQKMVFAHYLPWYDATGSYAGSWTRRGWCYEGDCADLNNVGYSNMPRIGEYSLADADVIDYHILTAFMAGIDGFIINLDPSIVYHKTISTDVLDRLVALQANHAELADFKIIISYDSSSADPTTITNDFTDLYNDFYQNSTYESLMFRDEITNNQVLITWSETDVASYYSTVNTIWGDNEVTMMVRNAVNFDDSDGNFGWIAIDNSADAATYWGESYFNDFEWRIARQSSFGLTDPFDANQVMMGMAYPGFDDANVPTYWASGVHRLINRTVTAGETMALTWDRQINYSPNTTVGLNEVENAWMQLITWNDWPEGTSIEPATDATYGFTPLLTSKAKTDTWKGNNGYGNECIEVPYLIYEATKAGFTTEANNARTMMMNGQCSAATMSLNAVLPIELVDFTVACLDNKIEFRWQTSEEVNVSHFEIQEWGNGKDWITIAMTTAKNQPNHYVISMDEKMINSTLFRLKTVDNDGTISHSLMVNADCLKEEMDIRFYPNPVGDQLFISVKNSFAKPVKIELFTAAGQQVYSSIFNLEKRNNQVFIENLKELSGLYFYKIQMEGAILKTGKLMFE